VTNHPNRSKKPLSSGERYVGQIQTWTNHIGDRSSRGAIYDTSQRRSNVGDMRHDFTFIEFTAPDALVSRLDELNRAARARSLEKITVSWRRAPRPEITELATKIETEACWHGYDLSLADVLFLAFKAGYEAAEADR
jgi:hypothetical protein